MTYKSILTVLGEKVTNSLLEASDFENFLNFRVGPLARKIQLLMARNALRPEGLTIQEWRVLLALARSGQANLAQVIDDSVQDPAHASRTVSKLVKRKLVRRTPDKDDRRRHTLALTSEGQATFQRIWPLAREINAQVIAPFDPDEFAMLCDLLDRGISAADGLLSCDQLQDEENEGNGNET